MIWHFFEVWLLLLGTFVIGCGLGAGLYAGIGNSRLASAQGVVADAIGDLIDGIKSRFGLGPEIGNYHRLIDGYLAELDYKVLLPAVQRVSGPIDAPSRNLGF